MACHEEVKIEGNRTCVSCGKIQAALFCFCTGARIYLCRGCIGDHTLKYPDLVHQLIRTDIEVSNLSAYRERSEAFAAGSTELKKNLTRIDQCCQEVTIAFNAMIESLGQRRDKYVTSLQKWKVTLYSEIMEAESEVKSSLAQENVQLRCKYSRLLRYYKSGPLHLFTYEINTNGYDNLAQNVVKFQYMEVQKYDSFEVQMAQTQVSAGPPLQPVLENAVDTTHQDLQRSEQEANRLRTLARSKRKSGENAEAIELHAAAHAIYARLFPDDINTARNLQNWGYALNKIGKSAEAVTKHASADAIYARLFPEDINTATNLQNWGCALYNMGKSAEAVTKYAAAHAIYAHFFPDHIKTAHNLRNWGYALNNMEKSAKAVTKHAAAHAIYDRLFPNDINAATNLRNWGYALYNMGKSAEAVTKYAAADTIYARFFPEDINTAHNLRKWGKALNNIGESAEAVRKFEAARLIYALNGSAENVRDCDQRLTS